MTAPDAGAPWPDAGSPRWVVEQWLQEHCIDSDGLMYRDAPPTREEVRVMWALRTRRARDMEETA